MIRATSVPFGLLAYDPATLVERVAPVRVVEEGVASKRSWFRQLPCGERLGIGGEATQDGLQSPSHQFGQRYFAFGGNTLDLATVIPAG